MSRIGKMVPYLIFSREVKMNEPNLLKKPMEINSNSIETNKASNRNPFLVAEYDALRNESLRCAQLISNSVWIGVTGFGLVIAAGASLLDKVPTISGALLASIVLIILCIQSIAISVIYLSELWKYIRVGYFLQTKIEPMFEIQIGAESQSKHWEQWVKDHRASPLYLISIIFLQIPIILTLVLLIIYFFPGVLIFVKGKSALSLLSIMVFKDLSIRFLLIFILLVNIFFIILLVRKVYYAKKGEFS
jgi:hypothetical protein